MKKNNLFENGLTLIALIITIIIMLILISVTITITLNSGLLIFAKTSSVQTDISIEKEKIYSAYISAFNSDTLTVDKENLKQQLDNEFGTGNIDLVKGNNLFIIFVKQSSREYYIKSDGEIELKDTVERPDVENTLPGSGTQEDPYKIYYIEDLLALSAKHNNSYIELENDLDFESFYSYRDYSTIIDNKNNINLMESLITGTGFRGVPNVNGITFDGNNHFIKNMLIDKDYSSLGPYYKEHYARFISKN